MPIFKLLSKKFTYQKKDKLKSRKQTQFLFSNGKAITMHPIRLIYNIENAEAGIFPTGLLQAGVGAPSRHFRKAVQRNRVKRLLREGYRLEKPDFMSAISLTNTRLNLFFICGCKCAIAAANTNDDEIVIAKTCR